MTIDLGINQTEIGHVSDAAYATITRRAIDASVNRCLCSVFIVDTNTDRDPELAVDELLLALQAARWRGVDARLMIGGSHDNLAIAQACFAALSVAELHEVPARWLTREAKRGSHVKMVVADDVVVTGSHNWSGGALTGQIQDSVAVRSPQLAARCASLFGWQWQRAALTRATESS